MNRKADIFTKRIDSNRELETECSSRWTCIQPDIGQSVGGAFLTVV